MLGNIYARLGERQKEQEIRDRMRAKNIKKIPGQTWIEVNGKVHSFIAGQECSAEVFTELTNLWNELLQAGYKPGMKV